MRLAIIVVNYGSSALLAENLLASASASPDALIVVCDNFSTEREAAEVRELGLAHGWTVISSASNLGFGAGVDLAISRAQELGATDFLLLNPDARIDGPSVAALAEAVAERRMRLVAPVIRTSDGGVWFDGADLYLDDGQTRAARKRTQHPGARTAPWLSGACVWITAEVFEATGGFGPAYFLYWEDVDLSWRAAEAGADLLVVGAASAVHDAGGTQATTGHRGKSRTYYYYNVRNRLLFAAQHLDDAGIRQWLKSTRAISWQILMRGGRRQLLSDPGVLWAVGRGIRDGRRIARAALSRD